MTSTSRQPVYLAADPETAVRTPWGDRISEVVPVNLTSGAFSSLLVDASPSPDRPAYVHHAADEAFVVLSGTATFAVAGDDYAVLGPGAAVYVPRGVRRSFRTGPAGARLLVTQTPGWKLTGPCAQPAADPDGETLRQLAVALAGCGIELLASPPPVPGRATSGSRSHPRRPALSAP
ncbi:cupin domain-containing protein [Geodermatophilus sp. URMC 64]